jgi:meso-butanediol dehydrogenase/(S,S)-butanediol dehydrogenase/diacetyl reductase
MAPSRGKITEMSETNSSVAVVTGSARGIGLAIAKWFFKNGYRVALLDRDEITLKTACEGFIASDRLLGIRCDVSNQEEVSQAIDTVLNNFGRIDSLVNNAGIAIFKSLDDTSLFEFRQVFATNLEGAFICSQSCIPQMKIQGSGSIVNIASISGLRASTLRIAYGTSKAALIHMTKQQAVELGSYGIRANAIAPGPVETEMAKLVHSVAIRSDYYDTIPLNRYGTVDEIAETAGFLCSPNAGYINGQVIAVDGGFDSMGVGLPTLRKNAGIKRSL